MDISLVAAESRETFFHQLSTCIDEKLTSEHADQVRSFAQLYYDQYPLEELEGRAINDVYGSAYSWWNFIQHKDPRMAKVKVFNPTLEEDGWLSPHTIVAVLQNDMPFLVDSVRIAVNNFNISLHGIKSTVMNLARDDKGELLELMGPGAKGRNTKKKQFGKEAFIYLEINLHTDESEMAELARAIEASLVELDTVVQDYKPMAAKAEEAEKNLLLAGEKALEDRVTESRDFIRWLSDGHFTFLGYAEYAFEETKEGRCLKELPEKRLGLFKQYPRKAPQVKEADFNEGMARFHLSPQLLSCTKSSVRSRIHRNAYSDYVVVKLFDDKGNVRGEGRFMGLYTSPVYTLSPSKIPMVREKLRYVMERSGLDPMSHDGKVLRQVIETFPRDELFQSSASELFECVIGVARINERHMVRLFMRRDPYGKFVNCIVYVPREDFSTRLRLQIQNLIGKALNAQEHEFNTYFSESVLARSHIVFKVDPDDSPDFDIRRLEERIVDISRSWEDHLLHSLCDALGEERGSMQFSRYGEAFPLSYCSNFEARVAVQDIEIMSGLTADDDIAMSFYQPMGADKHSMRFKVFHHDSPLELSEIIPVLEHLGLRVLGEHPYEITDKNGQSVWLHDFNLLFGLDTDVDVHSTRHNFQDAFAAIWRGKAESDAFNRLVLGARLSWREVAILRGYARYMKQTAFNFSQTYIANTLANHLEITRNLVALFKASYDPRVNQKTEKDLERIERLRSKILESVDKVDNLNEDRIIRRYLDFIGGTLRTNFFQKEADGENKSYISFKFSPQQIADIPEPRPMYEIFVYSPRMEGVHLRGGKVARGGLRWSDRLQDYRTEVLGLVKAQQVKNAVIVPSGAKGGFVAKQPPKNGGREAFLKEGIACYRMFIRGLLDVTDNIVEGEIVPPTNVVRPENDDPYLVVAADKGTATFSDIANEISEDYGHWLGDAFASGGSQGYDHKGMGITAKGAWVSVQRHFKEKGIDVQNEDFTVIGIGDMGGDVFGNGMLLSKHICLTAAFNHLHIFIDPNPDSAKTFVERERLFNTPGTSWEDFDKKLISKGGGIFKRSAKSIPISAEMKACFDIKADKLTPTELITALLKAPVDLIWNGGIGTYVKASHETHAEVGDKANDVLRINGNELRCKVFGEGGNLGVTQQARVEFCLHGGACNSDFIDNAAGVDCSDHEVNIKILIDGVVANGDMTAKQRNKLLADMTDEVSDLVLANNYKQTQAISIAEKEAYNRSGEYHRIISQLESEGRLDRGLEFIPDDETLLERYTQGKGLTRPELSVLVSYIKVALKEELADTSLTDDEYMAKAVETTFPNVLRDRFKGQIYDHRLRMEIVATQIANDMVNHMGISFCHRLIETTGSSFVDIAKAYVITRDVYRMHEYFERVEALDFTVPAGLQYDLMVRMMRRMRRGTRWFLRNRRGHLSPSHEVEAFAEQVHELLKAMPEVMCGSPKEAWEADAAELVEQGIPKDLAFWAAMPAGMNSGLGMVESARITGAEPVRVAEIYFHLGDRLGLHWFAEQISDAMVENYWQAIARETFMDDIESQMRTLAVSLIRLGSEEEELSTTIDRWMAQHTLLVERWRSMINELQAAPGTDFAMYSVALRELLDLAQASQHCTSLDDSSQACVLGT
ncbi:NAD-glutamate dehydrogenase GdhB [Maricurvus nonylphenolicus]|uniref:NAD-glutamate dehydrogenase n=1 Tax=Maricurvus nonylphenolicus TaxID=1008307 RepID=UPI0036F257B2